MVFCLCTGGRCFSRTLVINPKGTINKGKTLQKINKIRSHHPSLILPNGTGTTDVQEPTSPEQKVDIVPNNKSTNLYEEEISDFIKNENRSQEPVDKTESESTEHKNTKVDIVPNDKSTNLYEEEISDFIKNENSSQEPVDKTESESTEHKNTKADKTTEGTVKSSVKKTRAPLAPISSSSSATLAAKPNLNEECIEDEYMTSNLNGSSTNTSKDSIDLENITSERREGVAPRPVRIDDHINKKLPVHEKTANDEALIRNAIESNDFLNKVISEERLKDVIAAMYNTEIDAKQTIIKQGDKGQHMYVSAKGTFNIIVNGKVVDSFKDVRVFGELAILYSAKRLATIKAVTAGRVWVLDNNVYQQIVIRSNLKKENEIQNFLLNNEILNVVGKDALQVVSTLLKTEFFTSGETIIKQGERGDKFFIIRAGTVTISKTEEGIVGIYKKGDCFGELALLEEISRQATVTANAPGVECLTLTRKEFIDHLGEIKKFKYIKVKDKPKDSIHAVQSEFENISLRDLRIIKTLGVGGFGRVELVQHTKNENLVFALKYLKKIDIVQQNQQEHVFNEKEIQINCRSPFIARLYRTYKDKKYIYFLMETCLGGDLWSLLQRQKNRRFEEKEAKFICACVLMAFEYLHSRGIIYRDLKPENLLIATNGYIKLTDFGFAKKIIGRGKTYTFAGTPEYVAPEIVLNRGHDRAVDYWAFGSFVFEMLTGRTPFRTDDSSHMRTYNKILSGIDNIEFPTYINLKARHLIEKLCRPVPSERLGMQRRGIQDIKTHKWFAGFNWEAFNKMELHSSFKPKLAGPIDTKCFDHFKRDTDTPPDEFSGWDEHF